MRALSKAVNEMNMKELVKRVIRAIPCKYQIYKVARAMVRHSKPLYIADAREQLMRIHPKPSYHYSRPHFIYEQPDKDLSIIVPAYNVERFIGPCLESILNQETKVDFEVIVVNDGSTDNTGAVITRYAQKDNRIRVINQQNKGLSGARNTGIKNSHGHALMFVDSDDALAQGCVENFMEALSNSNCDYVTGLYTVMDEDGTVENHPAEKKRTLGAVWGRVFKREVWTNIRFPEGYLFEDTIMAYVVRPFFKEKQISDAGYLWRRRKGSISHNVNSKVVDAYWIVERMFSDRKLMGFETDDYIRALTVNQFGSLLYSRCSCLGKENLQAVFVEASHLLRSICQDKPAESYVYEVYNKDIAKALRLENYNLWKISCIFKLINEL